MRIDINMTWLGRTVLRFVKVNKKTGQNSYSNK